MLAKAIVIAVSCFAAATLAMQQDITNYTFEAYLRDFNKRYTDVELKYRARIFYNRVAEIAAFNAQRNTYKKGINRWTDVTDEERWEQIHRKAPRGHSTEPLKPTQTVRGSPNFHRSAGSLPRTVDYRGSIPSVITAVKDNGDCASSFAFAAAQAIESAAAWRSGMLFDLSVQQLLACTPNPNDCGGDGGCGGATAKVAFDYLSSNSSLGIAQEWAYGYTAHGGASSLHCLYNSSTTLPVVRLSGYVNLPPNDAFAVMEALASMGPVVVTSMAGVDWADYAGGVFSGCSYVNNVSGYHIVQLVGYGHDDALGLDYWVVRNSWNADWGEGGYIRLLRGGAGENGKEERCGWDVDWVTQGGGCNGDVEQLWACGTCAILLETFYPLLT